MNLKIHKYFYEDNYMYSVYDDGKFLGTFFESEMDTKYDPYLDDWRAFITNMPPVATPTNTDPNQPFAESKSTVSHILEGKDLREMFLNEVFSTGDYQDYIQGTLNNLPDIYEVKIIGTDLGYQVNFVYKEEVYSFIINKQGKVDRDSLYTVPAEIRLDIIEIVERGDVSQKRSVDNEKEEEIPEAPKTDEFEDVPNDPGKPFIMDEE